MRFCSFPVRALGSVFFLLAAPAHAADAPTEIAAPPTDVTTAVTSRLPAIGLRLDCLHNFNQDKGSSQQCISVTGLRYTHKETISPRLHARLRLDPFGSPAASRENDPDRRSLPSIRDSEFLIIDDYAIIWAPRPNLEIGIEEYGGAANIPATSGLALASRLSDTGWDQTALTVTYILPGLKDMHIQFAAGNGEGENGKNSDPQQYFGFRLDSPIVTGVKIGLGISLDGNSSGSAQSDWGRKQYEKNCSLKASAEPATLGHSTQRFGIGIELDGKLPAARGVKAGFGWQRTTATDLSKSTNAEPTLSDLQTCNLDLGQFFVEDPAGAASNTVERTLIDINASYRILDRFFVGIDYESRQIDTGKVKLFTICSDYTDATCTTSGSPTNKLTQTAFTVGGGVDLEEGLTVSFDYNRTTLDKAYSQAYYLSSNGKPSDALELFNGRIAYNWQ